MSDKVKIKQKYLFTIITPLQVLPKIIFTRNIVVETRAIKRSLSGSPLCSAGLFQSPRRLSGLRSTDHLPPKKESSHKNGSSFFCCLRSQSPHVPCLRSLGLLHPQYRFIPLRYASYASLYSSSYQSIRLC